MTTIEYRQWATEHGHTHGSMMGLDCKTIAEAEEYTSDYPRDIHDFATCGCVEVPYTSSQDTIHRLRVLLLAAGYRWSDEGWHKDGWHAQATHHDRGRYAIVNVYATGHPVALATGADGYLHHGDRPTVD